MNDYQISVSHYLWHIAGEAKSLEHARTLRKAALILKQYAEGETNDESGTDNS